jgi:DNA invertase Pin-like site-specific DNA recombinase
MSFEKELLLKIGYARVSTDTQTHDGQIAALRTAGCDKIFTEVASGARKDRPALVQALDYLRPHSDDVLTVYKLDRVGRSLPHLIQIMDRLEADGIGLHSVTEAIDTSTPGGRLLFHLMGSLAAFERDLVVERTKAGLTAAKAKGRVGGRPRQMTDDKINAVRELLASGTTVKDAAAAVGVSVPTLYRWVPGSSRSTAIS